MKEGPGSRVERDPGPLVLVVPCFNEAARLDVDRYLSFVDGAPDVRFLFVDDGSTDETFEVLSRMAEAADGRVETYRLANNGGKSEAVRQGVLEALRREDPWAVGFWDADLATPLEEVARFREVLEARPDVDLVMGSRVKLLGRTIHRHVHRHAFGRVFATAVATLLALPVYDTQCGAKVFRAGPYLERVFGEPFLSRWVFDVELIARLIALWEPEGLEAADRIFELPLERWEDVAGSKVGPFDAVVAARDLTRIGSRYRAALAQRRRRIRALVP